MDSASTSSFSLGLSITTRRSWRCSSWRVSRWWWTPPSTGSCALACAGIGPARRRPDAARQERSRPAGPRGLESGDRFVQSFARVQPKEADVTVRSFSLVAALVLVPAMARSEAAAEPSAAPAAPAAAAEPADQQTPSAGPGSSSRFVTTLYGYLEGDVIHDSQRAALDSYGGNPTLQLPGTFLGDNGRTVFNSRGTRLGM